MIIYIDETCAFWQNDHYCNELFLNLQVRHIRDIVKHRGYIYWNQIYETLGVEWDTRCENHCIEDASFSAVISWDGENDRWVLEIY